MASRFDTVLAFSRVMASAVKGAAKAVLVNLDGFANGEEDADAEGAVDEPMYGPIGFYCRPKGPQKADGATGLKPEGFAEVIAARLADGLLAFAGRDLRLSTRVNPAEGEVGLVQYGGGFISMKDASDGKGTEITLYSPHLNDDGTTQRAHAISYDPANDTMTIVHSSGASVVVTANKELVLRSDTGEARIILKGDTITMQAQKIIAQGNVVVGANPVGALPLVAGAASPPCPSLWLSPV